MRIVPLIPSLFLISRSQRFTDEKESSNRNGVHKVEEETLKRHRIPGRKPLMDDWNQVAPFQVGSRHGNCSKQRKARAQRWRRARVQRVVTAIGPCLHACMRWHALGLQVPPSCVVAPQPTTRTISKITGDSRNYPALSRYVFLCIRAGITPTGFSVIFNPGLGRTTRYYKSSAFPSFGPSQICYRELVIYTSRSGWQLDGPSLRFITFRLREIADRVLDVTSNERLGYWKFVQLACDNSSQKDSRLIRCTNFLIS